jgi:FkbM family methyltransferase
VAAERVVSFAQNGEDIVLWRALRHVREGVYVDVGGWDPDVDSVTRLFYERGWRGVDVEPVPEFAEKFRERRPRNEVVQAAVTDLAVDEVVLHRVGSTGLSTLDDRLAADHSASGFETEDVRVPARRLDDVLEASALVDGTIHFLKVDVEGAEAQVLRSVDLDRWRPWVLVIEATLPNSTTTSHAEWEQAVLDAGYTFTLFDGLSRYYVSPDHPELAADLGYPACTLDEFVVHSQLELEERLSSATLAERRASEDAVRWRNMAVTYWADSVAAVQTSDAATSRERIETERLSVQLTRVRAKVEKLRAQRDQARRRVARLQDKVDRMSVGDDGSREVTHGGSAPGSTIGRLRTAIRRARR